MPLTLQPLSKTIVSKYTSEVILASDVIEVSDFSSSAYSCPHYCGHIIVAMIHAVTAPKQEAVMLRKLEWDSVPAEINSSIQQSVHRVEPLSLYN